MSRALNNHPDVSEEAKRRISEIVAERGFVPNSNARQLKRQQAKCIAFIVKGTTNMFFSDMLVELQRRVSEAGYDGVVQYLAEGDDEVALAQQLCGELKPKGLIFLGGDSRNFASGFSGGEGAQRAGHHRERGAAVRQPFHGGGGRPRRGPAGD